MSTPRRPDPPAPSFEFEDGSPAVPASPPPAAGPEAPVAFNPFAEQQISLAPQAPAAPATPTPGAKAPGPGTKAPGAAAPVAPVPVVTPDAGGAPSPQDLWYCPHCGAGNQKKRETCRSCGKSPKERVQTTFLASPAGKASIAAAVVALLLIIFTVMKTDKTFHEPGPKQIDTKVRNWGGFTEQEIDLGDKRRFVKKGMLSVNGRVLAFKNLPGYEWLTTVVLALGPEANNDQQLATWCAGTSISTTKITSPAPNVVVLHCIFEDKPELVPGAWMSVIGPRGDALFEGQFVTFTRAEGHVVVKPERCEIRKNRNEE